MQLKLYKRSTLILGIIVALTIGGIVFILTHTAMFEGYRFETVIGFSAFILLLTFAYSYYDLNADRNMIRKAVRTGNVALAKINGGTFVRYGRDARFRNHVYWQLDIDLYDNDMKKIKATMIEKFSIHQTQIPTGFIFVTYKDGNTDDILAVPNVIISSIPEYQPFVEDYEKHIHPKYLNCYYNNGLILQTYQDALKQQKAAQENR